MEKLPKIIAIVGPTASGKTALGLELAKKFNGEIISADSRQIYKKMDIGTDKPKGAWQKFEGGEAYFAQGVPHYLMDIIDPGQDFSLADFKELAKKHINNILGRGKLPIMVGGTGLYFQSIIDNFDIPEIAPNKKLRKELEKKSLEELLELLKKLDEETFKKIDIKNPRRVVRALEVVILTGKSFVKQQTKSKPEYNCLQIGIKRDKEELYERINKRVGNQYIRGLLSEVESLIKQKYGWQLPGMTGIGYKQIGYYLRGEMSLDEAKEILKRDTRHYAKRQLTWFKRDERIKWIKEKKEAEKLIEEFIK